jgi:hypothetical protein
MLIEKFQISQAPLVSKFDDDGNQTVSTVLNFFFLLLMMSLCINTEFRLSVQSSF